MNSSQAKTSLDEENGACKGPLLFKRASTPTTEVSNHESISPTIFSSRDGDAKLDNFSTDDKDLRHNLFGKMTGILSRTLSRSRESSVSSPVHEKEREKEKVFSSARSTSRLELGNGSAFGLNNEINSAGEKVKETRQVVLEYDPMTRRKVLNTYEILREIGRGEHGKVKLAKNLINDELVAIKIVNRKSKNNRPTLRLRNKGEHGINSNEYEKKIRREIAIMKKCRHKHIVRLKEVLDDVQSYKIYLVLEYLGKGEIKWKRNLSQGKALSSINEQEIPCCSHYSKRNIDGASYEYNDLLSDEFSPNLTFKQSRKIFRDVILGLEYLHLQGIVHRDIKPANLLVSTDNVVKISDFGVSFASSLDKQDEELIDEVELAKTAGTPAFFAPELCQANFSSSDGSKSVSASSLEILKNDQLKITSLLPRIDYKIDIWALGVTLYCLLFGKVPFNAESEFDLFHVIVNQPLEVPEDRFSFNSVTEVSEEEFLLAKDLLFKMLNKDSRKRIEIDEIKNHPFTLLDFNGSEEVNEFLHFNDPKESKNNSDTDDTVSSRDTPVGIGSRIRKSLIWAMKSGDKIDTRKSGPEDLDNAISPISDESSSGVSRYNSSLNLYGNNVHSVLLSEAAQISSPPCSSPKKASNGHDVATFPSNSLIPPHVKRAVSPGAVSHSIAGSKEVKTPNMLLQDIRDTQSPHSSRRGSSSGFEAVQIETKRNVGGDLYLKNQSIVDTFKDIQQQDDKRRRSSGYGNLNGNGNVLTKHKTHVVPDETLATRNSITPIQPKHAGSQLRVGPINIGEESESSIISLPLTESFASLDSINDDYLTFKYQEYVNSKKNSNSNTFDELNFTKSSSNDNQNYKLNVDSINAKFKSFNLQNLMSNSPIKGPGISENDDCIAPNTVVANETRRNTSSSSSSSCLSYSDDDSDGEDNLTLAFSSKLAPPSRPQFLSMNTRAKSHDSHFPNKTVHYGNNKTERVPFVFQDNLFELEDVPAGLMSNVPRTSISADIKSKSYVDCNTEPKQEVKHLVSNEDGVHFDDKYFASANNLKHEKVPSIDVRPPVDVPEKAKRLFAHHRDNYLSNFGNQNNRFNNHYSKDPIYFPFPRALHNAEDKESKNKANSKQEVASRPEYNRSSSVTLGLLLRNTDNESS